MCDKKTNFQIPRKFVLHIGVQRAAGLSFSEKSLFLYVLVAKKKKDTTCILNGQRTLKVEFFLTKLHFVHFKIANCHVMYPLYKQNPRQLDVLCLSVILYEFILISYA